MLSDYLRRDLLQQSVAVALMQKADDILSAHEQPVFSAPRHQPDLIAQGIHLLDLRLFAHPLFLNQLVSLTAEVEGCAVRILRVTAAKTPVNAWRR